MIIALIYNYRFEKKEKAKDKKGTCKLTSGKQTDNAMA